MTKFFVEFYTVTNNGKEVSRIESIPAESIEAVRDWIDIEWVFLDLTDIIELTITIREEGK